jgi:hypothetical protein
MVVALTGRTTCRPTCIRIVQGSTNGPFSKRMGKSPKAEMDTRPASPTHPCTYLGATSKWYIVVYLDIMTCSRCHFYVFFKIQKFSNDIHEYSFKTNTWTLIKPRNDLKPHWRDFHTCTPVGDKLYLFGGRMDTGGDTYTGESFYCNKLHEFDLKALEWNEVKISDRGDAAPCGRRSQSASMPLTGCMRL